MALIGGAWIWLRSPSRDEVLRQAYLVRVRVEISLTRSTSQRGAEGNANSVSAQMGAGGLGREEQPLGHRPVVSDLLFSWPANAKMMYLSLETFFCP